MVFKFCLEVYLYYSCPTGDYVIFPSVRVCVKSPFFFVGNEVHLINSKRPRI